MVETTDEKALASLPDFDSLWDYDHPAETETKFREILPVATPSKDPSYYAQLLTQIARTQGLQRKFAEANRTLDETAMLLLNAGDRARVRYLLERGRVLNSSGNGSEAKPLFLEAWNLARRSGEDGFTVDAAHMLAIVESPESQSEWNMRALELAEKSVDPSARKWKGSLYNNMGWTLFESKKYHEALDMFQKALTWRTEQGGTPEIRIVRWCIAKTMRVLGRVEEALTIQRELLSEYEEHGRKSGYVFEEIGECLLALGRVEESRGFFLSAYAELSKDLWIVENESSRLARLEKLGMP